MSAISLVLIATLHSPACTLFERPEFARPCSEDLRCAAGYTCTAGRCLPASLPALCGEAHIFNVPTEKAADILIVVDNSGSMAEEQHNLVHNFLNQNAADCPLQDLKNIPLDLTNPVRDLYTGTGSLAKCGFIQLLAAFQNDFRVGVITTDVGLCDNRQGANGPAPDGWGFRPQRGCLQPDLTARKVIAAADLKDEDASNDDFATRFRETLEGIRTFGSPYERGLDAMAMFLDPATVRHETCTDDLGQFRRDNASLVVVFLTDEEDCSHGFGETAFPNEHLNETCGEYNQEELTRFIADVKASDCYDAEDTLTPVEFYVDALKRVDPKAKVAVIAGGLGEPGSVQAAGCMVGADQTPVGGCFESQGFSNFTGPGERCSEDTLDARDGLPCCQADPGDRYYRFADLVGQKTTDSICNGSFRSTMIDIAAFIAAVDFVVLAEPPANPDLVLVEVTRAATGEVQTFSELPPGASCADTSGWFLENDVLVVLCGGARPGPGDRVVIRPVGIADSCE